MTTLILAISTLYSFAFTALLIRIPLDLLALYFVYRNNLLAAAIVWLISLPFSICALPITIPLGILAAIIVPATIKLIGYFNARKAAEFEEEIIETTWYRHAQRPLLALPAPTKTH